MSIKKTRFIYFLHIIDRNNKIAPDEEQEREDDYLDNTSMSDTGPTAGASGNDKNEIVPPEVPVKEPLDPCLVETGESVFIHIQRQALLWNTYTLKIEPCGTLALYLICPLP